MAAERHNQELRQVCIDIATCCLPDVLVSHTALSLLGLSYTINEQAPFTTQGIARAPCSTIAGFESAPYVLTELRLQRQGIAA